jgi:hypothetical protein
MALLELFARGAFNFVTGIPSRMFILLSRHHLLSFAGAMCIFLEFFERRRGCVERAPYALEMNGRVLISRTISFQIEKSDAIILDIALSPFLQT